MSTTLVLGSPIKDHAAPSMPGPADAGVVHTTAAGSAALATGAFVAKPAAAVITKTAATGVALTVGTSTFSTIGAALGANAVAGFLMLTFSAVGFGYVGYHSASWITDHIGKKAEN